MELKDFIRETLIGIEEGVHEANDIYKKARSVQDNAYLVHASIGPKLEGRGIEFDVAVTTTSEVEATGKAKLNIHVVEVSTGGGGQHTKESVSRIKFVVT